MTSSTTATLPTTPTPWGCQNEQIIQKKRKKRDSPVPPTSPEMNLPAGAQDLVKNIVAQRILELTLQEAIDRDHVDDHHLKKERNMMRKDKNNNNQSNNFEQAGAILDLVGKHPNICQRKYRFQMDDNRIEEVYPLFVLLQLQPTMRLVEEMFEAHPEAIFDTCAYRPIDIACEMHASLDVIRFLHVRHPDAVCTPVKDGRYPLHVALSFYNKHSSNDAVVDFLLNVYPAAASKQDSKGHYPLHHAAFGGAPVSTIQRLHELCPESITATDNKNWTPLHCACRYGRSNQDNLAVITYLVETAPSALSIRNQGGWTPILTAVGYQSKHVISYLLNQLPHVGQSTIRSMLRLAAKHNNDTESVYLVAKRYAWMLTSQNQNSGGTPLHYASKRDDDPVEIVRLLVEHNRQALTITDNQGRLPLNCAYHLDANSETTKFLLQETAKGGVTS